MSSDQFQSLATYRKLLARAEASWPAFVAKRRERLTQWQRHGRVAEKVAEGILEDLLTDVLDWALGDLNNQLDYADLLTNYRGARVGGIPESAVPDTLVRLAHAAARLGRMPEQNPETAAVYHQLAEVLRQLDRSYALP